MSVPTLSAFAVLPENAEISSDLVFRVFTSFSGYKEHMHRQYMAYDSQEVRILRRNTLGITTMKRRFELPTLRCVSLDGRNPKMEPVTSRRQQSVSPSL